MKKILASLLALMMFSTIVSADMILEYNGGEHKYTGSVYTLEVNGKTVATPLEPIIFNERALVPVREVFEALGAVVTYTADTREISIALDNSLIVLKIGSPYVSVNNVQKEIPDGIVPMLIAKQGESAKTMVPVRFVSESIGMNVTFDGANGVIRIGKASASPETAYSANITAIDTEAKSHSTSLLVTLSAPATKISELTMIKSSGVLYVDLYGVGYTVANNIATDNSIVKSIRLGSHEGYSRIALDVSGVINYQKTLSADGTLLKITVNGIGDTPLPTPTPTPTPAPTPTPLPNLLPSSEPSSTPTPTPPAHLTGEKIVVLDAGHGGSDPGAVYTHGNTEIQEKVINLGVTKKVESILTANGVRVELTRWNDFSVPLGERSELANQHGAAMFVSIHSNSFPSKTTVNGIEVFYSKTNNYDNYGITSKKLASDIYQNLINATGASQRGVKTEQHKVTRTSEMPAVLIELGFITNKDEGMKLYTAEYQDKLAQAIADAILKNLQLVKIPPTPIVRAE